MGRYQTQSRKPNPELIENIERVAARGVKTLTDWERGFLESLLDAAKKWGRLTEKQQDVFKRIEKNSDPAAITARNNWINSYDDTKRKKAIFAAEYYKANPPYFAGATERILSDPNYIPTEKLYHKMVENKYVTRAFENAMAPALYPAGSLATVRNNSTTSQFRRLYPLRDKNVLIISIDEHTLNSTKGSKKYTVLPVGATETIKVEERHLKKSKKS